MLRRTLGLLLVPLALGAGCAGGGGDGADGEGGGHAAATTATPPVTAAALCRRARAVTPAPRVAATALREASGPAGQLVTGGDVSPDGSLVALRTYGQVLVWDRAPGQSVADALAGRACQAPAPAELQGEALAFTPDGRGYATLSEGVNPALNRFHLP